MPLKSAVLILSCALLGMPLSAQTGVLSKIPTTSDVDLQQTSTSLGSVLQIPKDVLAIKGFVNPVIGSKIYAVELAPGETISATLSHPHGGVFLSGQTLLTSPGPRLGSSKQWTEFKNTSSNSVQLFLTVKDEEHWTSQEIPFTLKLQRTPQTLSL
jgi:hypothetical protein